MFFVSSEQDWLWPSRAGMPEEVLSWASREAWPARTASEWLEIWQASGEVADLQEALEAHPEFVSLRGPGGTEAVRYASRRAFLDAVVRALGRWCELDSYQPLTQWGTGVMRLLVGAGGFSPEPLWQAMSELQVAPWPEPTGGDPEPAAGHCWDRVLAGPPANGLRARFRLARMLRLEPEVRLNLTEARPVVELSCLAFSGAKPLRWADALEALSEARRLVVNGRVCGEWTFDQLGAILGISRERARQLEVQGWRQLRCPPRRAALGRAVAGLLGSLRSPLVFRPDAGCVALAPMFDQSIRSSTIVSMCSGLAFVDFEDVNGLLTLVTPGRAPAFEQLRVASERKQWRTPSFLERSRCRHAGRPPGCRLGVPYGGDYDLLRGPGGDFQVRLALPRRDLRGWRNHFNRRWGDTPSSPRGLPPEGLRIQAAFARGRGAGLWHLASVETCAALPPWAAFWRELGHLFVVRLCELSECAPDRRASLTVPPPLDWLKALCGAAPVVRPAASGKAGCGGASPGGLYVDGTDHPVTLDELLELWNELQAHVRTETRNFPGTLQDFLDSRRRGWHVFGRVHLWLSEADPATALPFHFRATYATASGTQGREAHRPLEEALASDVAAGEVLALRAMTAPLARASERSGELRRLVEEGRILRDGSWSAEAAYGLLSNLRAALESGFEVHVPDWWQRPDRPRPRVRLLVGNRQAPSLGLDVLLDFSAEVVLNGEPLSESELEAVLRAARGLMFLRNRWVEVDGKSLSQVLERCRQGGAGGGRMTMLDALRLIGRSHGTGRAREADELEAWSLPEAGPWMTRAIETLTHPGWMLGGEAAPDSALPLRPYQRVGLAWLARLYQLGLGGCLADDMGLGKTVQVLALLDWLKRQGERTAHLLVVPSSLLAHWEDELRRFVPALTVRVAHASARPSEELLDGTLSLDGVDLVVTSYSLVPRLEWLSRTRWGLIVLDEAQYIKTPEALSTQAVKRLTGRCRLALTGTPIENHLGDLWCLFDFLNPGLLG
ncbi:MAG: hypothetical protein HY814_05130 [Candidatus Riflebacteria bacterium]|nr:hypothetical protein [Candidatus Riflebacteria bacterium]